MLNVWNNSISFYWLIIIIIISAAAYMFYINEDLKWNLHFFVLIWELLAVAAKAQKLNNWDVIFCLAASWMKLNSTLKLIKRNLVFYKIN